MNQPRKSILNPSFVQRLKTLAVWLLALISLRSSEADADPRLRFLVTVPQGTEDQHIVVVGDHPKLGSWKTEGGLKLIKKGKRLYVGSLQVPKGTVIEFKIVRTGWKTVEKTARGQEMRNRKFKVEGSEEVILKVARWADSRAGSSACEHVKTLGQFGKASLGIDRPVWLHLPADYNKNKSYPVLYMLDGQNCFDDGTSAFGEWAADDHFDALYKVKKIKAFIIVAIGNSPRRMAEYTPTKAAKYGGGSLDKLETMIRKEIEPALAKAYKIKTAAKDRGVMGSSLGGLAAFHLGLRHPERYGIIGAISPSFWWDQYGTLKLLKKTKKLKPVQKLWIDIGTKEGDGRAPVKAVKDIAKELRSRGYGKKNLAVFVDQGANHSEAAWRKRLPKVFQWLYGLKGKKSTK